MSEPHAPPSWLQPYPPETAPELQSFSGHSSEWPNARVAVINSNGERMEIPAQQATTEPTPSVTDPEVLAHLRMELADLRHQLRIADCELAAVQVATEVEVSQMHALGSNAEERKRNLAYWLERGEAFIISRDRVHELQHAVDLTTARLDGLRDLIRHRELLVRERGLALSESQLDNLPQLQMLLQDIGATSRELR